MTVRELIGALASVRELEAEVRVELVDYTDDMTPVEVGVDHVAVIAGWRFVVYPEPLPDSDPPSLLEP